MTPELLNNLLTANKNCDLSEIPARLYYTVEDAQRFRLNQYHIEKVKAGAPYPNKGTTDHDTLNHVGSRKGYYLE